MALERKNRDDKTLRDAADVLSRLTDKSEKEFEADDYAIPDFENQSLEINESSEE